MEPESQDAEEVRRATKLLEALTKSLGLRERDLDERLGKAYGYHGELFSGRLELRYLHIVSVLRVSGVDPKLFFRALHPDLHRPPMPAAMMERFLDSLQQLGYGTPSPPPPPAAVGAEEIDHRIQEAVTAALGERSGKEQP